VSSNAAARKPRVDPTDWPKSALSRSAVPSQRVLRKSEPPVNVDPRNAAIPRKVAYRKFAVRTRQWRHQNHSDVALVRVQVDVRPERRQRPVVLIYRLQVCLEDILGGGAHLAFL
jgi:hypothetical protein